MEVLKKVYNAKLSEYIILYLRHIPQENTGSDLLFKVIQDEVNDMLQHGVVQALIFTYLLTLAQMLKVTEDYDIVTNYIKIDKILGLVYPDETERKKHLSQLITYCIKGNSVICDNHVAHTALNEMLSKIGI